MFPRCRLRIVAFAILAASSTCTAEVYLSEFMASNSGFQADEDGDFSDWIEIANPDLTAKDIGGYHLSDKLSNLQKWTVPAGVSVPAGGHLLVFASGKNRGGAGTELHTNFKLDADGESLVLVAPDGVTIVSQFADFTPQRSDVSYGTTSFATPAVDASNPVRVYVPADGSLGSSWTGGSEPFADGGWTAGGNGVGYETGTGGGPLLEGAKASADFGFKYEQDVGAQTQDLDSNSTDDFFAGEPTANPSPSGGIASFSSGDVYRTDFGNSIIRANFVADDPVTIEARIKILNSGGAEGSRGTMAIFFRDSDGSGAVVYLGRTGTGYLNSSNTYQTLDPSGNTDAFHTIRIAKDDDGVWVWRDGALLNPGGTALAESSVGTSRWGLFVGDSGSTNSGDWELDYLRITPGAYTASGAALYDDLIAVDLESEMTGASGNTSAYLRLPFSFAADPADFDQLQLRMRYDDGFVAYLNGVEIARRNAPASPAWESTATVDRPDLDALAAETINVTAEIGSLIQGDNILAIHALNSGTGADRALTLAELDTVELLGTNAFFPQPTPGAPNGTGVEGFVGDTAFDVDRGFFTAPFDVMITSSTPDAEIYYTTDGSVPSSDNGTLYTGPVTITTTTPLRAIATKPGFASSNVDTQTYIFLADVLTQDGAGLPAPDNPSVSDWDYEMDPNVVNDPRYSPDIIDDLKALPTMSVVLPAEDMWGADGIYNNPTQYGMAWERACSMEMIYPDAPLESFQEDCGIRIQGAGSRFRNLGKKSMRLTFRNLYGAGKLEERFFGPGTPTGFDNIVLRGSYFDSWTVHTAGSGTYIGWNNALQFRTDFGHLTHRDMGAHSILSSWAHLYINGVYWGIYNTHERPDEDFAELHLGGDESEYDVLKQRPRGQPNGSAPEVVNGDLDEWDALMALMAQDLADPQIYAQVLTYIELDQFIDYMLMNFYGGNRDWPHNNWYAIRHRPSDGPFIFYNWDPENYIFDVDTDRTGVSTNNSPGIIYDRLRENPEFRLRFADRVRLHMFNDGALTPAANAARFQDLVDLLRGPMTPESARWGDTRVEPPRNVIDTWDVTVADKQANYFPQRQGFLLDDLRNADLYPDTDPVDFNRHGGSVPDGFGLTMSSSDAGPGTIYFTDDGSDPRAPGGAIAPGATTYAASVPLVSNQTINARVRSPGGEWSALTTATFIIDAVPAAVSNLVISEIHYRPADATPAEELAGFTDRDDFEFVEILNYGAQPVDLTGMRFTDGVYFDFPPNIALAAGARLLLVSNLPAFLQRYGSQPPGEIAGTYFGNLNNDGDTVTLLAADDSVIHSLTYNDQAPWPTAADGDGYTLVLGNPAAPRSEAASWRASPAMGGSPGGTGLVPFAGDPHADLDRDGLTALLEHYLGTSDSVPGDGASATEISATGEFSVHSSPSATGVAAAVQAGDDLATWSDAEVEYLGESMGGAGKRVRRYRHNSDPGATRLFYRLGVSPE